MIYNKIIDEAFEFYNIDDVYKNRCYELLTKISKNERICKSFNIIYKRLYYGELKELWKYKIINDLFGMDIDPFMTNLILLFGYKIHKNNIEELKLDVKQINKQKKRIKESFENDLIIRKYDGIRVSQMLWGIYFIRGKIIEVGCLQFEYEDKTNIKIHIPRNTNLNILEVKKSINDSKLEIEKIFKIKQFKYICNSWLLSNQIYILLDKNSNISLFHNLFEVTDGDNCIKDILNFVYGINGCNDYNELSEQTTLQRKIKEELLDEKNFYLGLGVLKKENY